MIKLLVYEYTEHGRDGNMHHIPAKREYYVMITLRREEQYYHRKYKDLQYVTDTTTAKRLSSLRRVPGALWRRFDATTNVMDRFLVTCSIVLLILMWGFIMAGIIGRLLGTQSLNWSSAIIGFMLAWSVFAIAGPVTRSDEHIKVNFLPEKLLGEKRGKAFLYASENFIGMFICTYLAYQSYRLILSTHDLGLNFPSGIGHYSYPLWVIRLGILLGFLFCSVFYFERTLRWIRRFFIAKEATGKGNLTDTDKGAATEESCKTQEREDQS